MLFFVNLCALAAGVLRMWLPKARKEERNFWWLEARLWRGTSGIGIGD